MAIGSSEMKTTDDHVHQDLPEKKEPEAAQRGAGDSGETPGKQPRLRKASLDSLRQDGSGGGNASGNHARTLSEKPWKIQVFRLTGSPQEWEDFPRAMTRLNVDGKPRLLRATYARTVIVTEGLSGYRKHWPGPEWNAPARYYLKKGMHVVKALAEGEQDRALREQMKNLTFRLYREKTGDFIMGHILAMGCSL